MLHLVGLGLGGVSSLSLEAKRAIERSSIVLLDVYTSLPPGGDVEGLRLALEASTGKRVQPADRSTLEDMAEEVVEAAAREDVAVLVVGDPLVATTHSALMVLAARRGVRFRVIHAASVFPAAPVRLGLHVYKLAPPVTLPYSPGEEALRRDCEKIAGFLNQGLHCTVLLEQTPSEGRVLTPLEASRLLASCPALRGRRAVAVVSLGGDGRFQPFCIGEAAPTEIPSLLVIPSSLHFSEREAMEALLGVSDECGGHQGEEGEG